MHGETRSCARCTAQLAVARKARGFTHCLARRQEETHAERGRRLEAVGQRLQSRRQKGA